jgi:hypothetical protein
LGFGFKQPDITLNQMSSKPEVSTSNGVTRDEVKHLVQDLLRTREFEQQLTALITGTDLATRVRETVRREVPDYLSTQVSRSIDEYADRRLPDKMRLCASDELRRQLPDLVKGQILERLGQMSGVAGMLAEFKVQVHDELMQLNNRVRGEHQRHTQELEQIRTLQAESFRREAEQTAAEIVQSLVGTNGSVIKGFKDELLRQNNANFADHRVQTQHQIIELNQRCNQLESSVTTAWWILGAVGVGLVSSLAALGYVLLGK